MGQILTLEELKKLKERLSSDDLTEDEYNKIMSVIGYTLDNNSTNKSNEKEKSLVKSNPNIPSLLDKTGFMDVIYLATMSLVFEVFFLAVSFLIYK
jgi:hypothetical protein